MANATESSQESSQDSEEITFDELFDSFCKVGDRNAEEIALRNIDKWFKQAKLFTKEITTTDTAILFSKIAGMKKRLTKEEFQEMLNELAKEKEVEVTVIEEKLKAAGRPSFTGVTRPIRGSVAADSMDRLTNPSHYTGTHKERFDAEGKGLGLSGRYEVADVEGYVQGYKNKGTYGSQEGLDKEEGKKKEEDKK